MGNRAALELEASYDNAVVYAKMRVSDLYRTACTDHVVVTRATSAVVELRPARELCSAHDVTRRSTWCYPKCLAASPGNAFDYTVSSAWRHVRAALEQFRLHWPQDIHLISTRPSHRESHRQVTGSVWGHTSIANRIHDAHDSRIFINKVSP